MDHDNRHKAATETTADTMHVTVMRPDGVLLSQRAVKVAAEATNGAFILLPRHIDFVTPLVAGVVLLTGRDGAETVVGTDTGTLVKVGAEVRIATRRAVVGDELDTLKELVEREFRTTSTREQMAQRALARLEAGIVRRFVEIEEQA